MLASNKVRFTYKLSILVALFAVVLLVTTLDDSDVSDAAVGTEFTVDGYNYAVTSDNPRTVVIKGPVEKNITTINIPETVTYSSITYTVTSISASAFTSCTSATSITIPKTITWIGSNAFAYCRAVTSLYYDVPQNTNTDAEYIFAELGSNGTGVSVTFGKDVRTIHSSFFAHRNVINAKPNYVKTIVIEEGTTYINANAFSNCTSLAEVTIPSTVKEMGNRAFYDCVSLSTVYMNAKSLHDFSSSSEIFSQNGLKSFKPITLIFGDTVERIPSYFASGGYSKIKEVIIPASVQSIGTGAFNGNKSLTKITMYGAPELEGIVFSCGTSMTIVNVSVQSICGSGFLSSHANAQTRFTYTQLPHVTLDMSGMNPSSVPKTWFFRDGSLIKYYGEGETITIPSIHVTGYTFAGWNSTPATTMGTVNLIYVSSWTINHVTVSFDTKGGTAIDPISADFGTPLSFEAPTKTGYWLSGWSPALPATIPEYDTKYTAIWTLQKHDVTYDSQKGTAVPKVSLNYGQAIPQPEITRTGYNFMGWTLTPSGNTMGEQDVIAVANWEIKSITLSFSTGEGTPISPITADYGTNLSVPNPTLTGYTFVGWSPALPSTMPESNQTFTAQWQIQEHTVTYNSNGGDEVDSATIQYGQTIPQPIITRTGYDFQGWTLSPTGTTMGEQDVQATAKWTIRSVTVSFITGSGTSISPITANYGTSLSVSNPTRTGYNFIGWSPELPATMPENNQTYTAQWQIQSHTVTYYSNGGTNVPSTVIQYGETIPQPSITRTGYQFLGWTLNPSGNTMGESNVTATASWDPNTVTITFNTNGGTTIDPITEKVGTSVNVPKPTKTGYTFAGWLPSFNNKMPTQDTTYSASWNVQYHTVTYNTGGGTNVPSKSVAYNSLIPFPSTNPTRTGYEFVEWSVPAGTRMGTTNITVNAIWEGKYYSVYCNNPLVMGPVFIQSYQCGKPISGISVPEFKGYDFKGWEENVTTMPAETLFLTPILVPAEEKTDTTLYLGIGAIGILALVGGAIAFTRFKH